MRKDRFVAIVGAALVVVGASGCSQAQTRSEKLARVTVGGNTFTTNAPMCTQQEMYRTIAIGDLGSRIEAVVLLDGNKVLPQWVKIRDFEGFTGSFWKGGVGDAHADIAQRKFTITGSAFGINRSSPNKATTTDFNITAVC